MDNGWLKNLKMGDKVIVHHNGLGQHDEISVVEKVTPAGRVKVNGILFDNRMGFALGEGYHRPHLGEPTEAAVKDCQRSHMLSYLSGFKWSVFNHEQLLKITGLVKAEKEAAR